MKASPWTWLGAAVVATAAVVEMPSTDMSILGRIYQPLPEFSGSIFDEARDQLTKALDEAIATGESAYGAMYNHTAFSASVFSLKTGESVFDYHYQAPDLPPESYTKGKISEDTIYRIGSLTKATTIYVWLVGIGESGWMDPITKYLPELADAMNSYQNPIMSTNWSEVTIGSLASQMSGIGRDYHLGDLALQSFQSPPPETALLNGYPPLPDGSVVQCDSYGDKVPQCTRAQFLQGVIDHPPVNPAYQTASYSNVAYGLLGLAYESATGVPFDQAADELFVNQLGMTATTSHAPAEGFDAVVPRNESYALFTYDIGVQGPAGNQYSSIKDLRTWGHAIYTNKFLDPAVTRRWLSPKAFTSRWTSAVGAPWEIYRIALPVNPIVNSSRIVDTYTKGGNVGMYASTFAMVPEFELGFAILSAGDLPGTQKMPVRALLVDVYYNALETAMKAHAKATFTGTYHASSDLNSSLTLEVDSGTGVYVKSWISNGTEMTTNAFYQAFADFRLYPTALSYHDEAENITYHKYYLATLFQEYGEEVRNGDVWHDYNDYWIQVDGVMYDNLATDSWVVGFDDQGMVVSVESQAVRCKMFRD